MKLGLPISLLGHSAAVAAGVIILPQAMRDYEPAVFIPAELVREAEIADFSDVRAAAEEPEPEPEPEETPEPEPEPEPEPAPPPPPPPPPEPEPEPEPEPAPPPPEPKPKPEPEPEPEPEPPPPPPPPPENDFLASLDNLAALRDTSRDAERREVRRAPEIGANRRAVGVGEEFRLTVRDAINSHFLTSGCWNPPLGAPNPETLNVDVEFRLKRDGTLDGAPKVLGGAASSSNQFLVIAAEEARRAVIR